MKVLPPTPEVSDVAEVALPTTNIDLLVCTIIKFHTHPLQNLHNMQDFKKPFIEDNGSKMSQDVIKCFNRNFSMYRHLKVYQESEGN